MEALWLVRRPPRDDGGVPCLRVVGAAGRVLEVSCFCGFWGSELLEFFSSFSQLAATAVMIAWWIVGWWQGRQVLSCGSLDESMWFSIKGEAGFGFGQAWWRCFAGLVSWCCSLWVAGLGGGERCWPGFWTGSSLNQLERCGWAAPCAVILQNIGFGWIDGGTGWWVAIDWSRYQWLHRFLRWLGFPQSLSFMGTTVGIIFTVTPIVMAGAIRSLELAFWEKMTSQSNLICFFRVLCFGFLLGQISPYSFELGFGFGSIVVP